MVALIDALDHLGSDWSIENPLDSLLWQTRWLQRLLNRDGVQRIELDQCAFGSLHRKPTLVLTSATWLGALGKRCSGVHRHVPLCGKVLDYRDPLQPEIFFTALAAEYPSELCEAFAECWRVWLHSGGGQKEVSVEELGSSTLAPA
eukprot:6368630-Amphidinium_carterae.1